VPPFTPGWEGFICSFGFESGVTRRDVSVGQLDFFFIFYGRGGVKSAKVFVRAATQVIDRRSKHSLDLL
jgi:hypothetical protein